jgi:hypothetical protein
MRQSHSVLWLFAPLMPEHQHRWQAREAFAQALHPATFLIHSQQYLGTLRTDR